jgi:hypothetical protein
MIPKGQSILVHPLRSLPDCTNGGVTAEGRLGVQGGWDSFYLVEPGDQEAIDKLLPRVEKERILVLDRIKVRDVYIRCRPLEEPEGVGWMAGGNYVHTSDGRYSDWLGIPYPIAVHDRQETPELYRAMST